MKVLLAGPDYEENLSIRYLSSSLQSAGHETVLAAFNSKVDLKAVADAADNADIVGLSLCFQSRAREFLELARLIKFRHPSKPIVLGGHYASCAAEPLLANHAEIDVIVIHEGEKTLLEIADAMPHLEDRLAQISGIAYRSGQQVYCTTRRHTLDDLDSLPFPDRRGPLRMIAGVPTSYMMGSRGCYESCAYCCITTLHRIAPGKRFRRRDPEHIADEMAELYRDRGTRQFVFHDDNFLVPATETNHARLSAFERALKSRGIEDIALVIKCRPADAKHEILRRLKELGLVRLFLGIESATSRGLSALARDQSVEESERALETCARLDISAQFTLMTFNPDTTLATLRADVAFMRRFCGNPLNFCRAEIYAGTPLERQMIELGRARGNYLARVYSLADPVADLACNLALDLFRYRCWNNDSLMQNAIGLDHSAAVLKRFHKGSSALALVSDIGDWLRSVNLDTIDLLEEVVELSALAEGRRNAALERAMRALSKQEVITRQALLRCAFRLRAELNTLCFSRSMPQTARAQGPRRRLVKQAAAALLAIGMPAAAPLLATTPQVYALQTSPADQQNAQCSLSGTVRDPSGAVVANATITITNLETQQVRSLKTNQQGQYAATGLPAGRYTVKAEMTGFTFVEKTGIVLQAGSSERADIVLQIGNYECCEYAAQPLNANVSPVEILPLKRRPFTYKVGTYPDKNTLKGIAQLVYGNANMWVQIFEANRNVIRMPEYTIPYGTELVIPKEHRNIPKLIYKVTPTYPAAAREQKISGDVVTDVELNSDGTVKQVSIISGDPRLADATIAAVKQWRYRIAASNRKAAVLKFVVVVSFSKTGRVSVI